MSHRFAFLMILMLCGFDLQTEDGTDKVSFVDFTQAYKNPNNRYFIELLERALQASEMRYGPYEMQPVQIHIMQSRQLKELNKGTIDVFWSVSTPPREAEVIAVDFPLIKGAYGIRLLVAHKQDMAAFQRIGSLDEFKQVPIMVGRDWPDASLLALHGFKLDTTVEDLYKYHSLNQ